MVVWVYTDGQRLPLEDPIAYPGGIPVPVNEVYAYHDEGQRSLVWSRSPMDASAVAESWDSVRVSWTPPGAGADSYVVRRGGSIVYSGIALEFVDTLLSPGQSYQYTVDAIRSGSVVQQAKAPAVTTPAYPSIALSATAPAWNSVALSWTALDGSADQYVLKRSSTTIYSGDGKTSHTDGSRAAGTTYSYTLEHRRSGVVLASKSASVKTPARPTTVKTVTLSPSSSGSYLGNGNLRSTGSRYSGNYTPGSNGTQKSSFHFAIPADVRNCIRIKKVEFSARNSHTYGGTGVTQYLSITHTQAAGATWPGSTGAFGGRFSNKGGWYGNSEWVDVTNWKEPTFNDTVANNFRSRGAWGICLYPPDGTIGYYSYWTSGARLRIEYEVYT